MTRSQELLEQLRNRADWALKAMFTKEPSLGFKTTDEEFEHHLDILDSIATDYLAYRRFGKV